MDGLYIDPRADKPAPKFVSFRVNDKGTPIFTVRKRKPKLILIDEIENLAKQGEHSKEKLLEYAALKKIKVLGRNENGYDGLAKAAGFVK